MLRDRKGGKPVREGFSYTSDNNTEWKGAIIGWTGSSFDYIKINGYDTSRFNNIFYLPLETIDFTKVCGNLEVLDLSHDNSFKFKYFVHGGKKQVGGEIKFAQELEYTLQDTYKIRGTSNNNDYHAFINGNEITINDAGEFESDIKLKNGYQRIEIVLKDGNTVKSYWTKEIYKVFDTIRLDIQNEQKELYTNEAEYVCIGRITNAINPILNINGSKVPLINGEFEHKLSLDEGENLFAIQIVDDLGRTYTDKFNIIKDTQVPDISLQLSENIQYFADSNITITADSSESDLIYVFDNGEKYYCDDLCL